MTPLLHQQPPGLAGHAEPDLGEDIGRARFWRVAEVWLCGFCLLLLGWRGVFHYQTSYGTLVGLALLPVWVGALRKFRGALASSRWPPWRPWSVASCSHYGRLRTAAL